MKTSELTGAALDWAVAKCEGRSEPEVVNNFPVAWYTWGNTHYSTGWAQGGPIIEREGINLDNYAKNPKWSAWTPAPDRESGEAQAYGPTPLIAAMRCYVASKLGDEVELPTELNCI
jgi:Protein of unknown function (DUF2591)